MDEQMTNSKGIGELIKTKRKTIGRIVLVVFVVVLCAAAMLTVQRARNYNDVKEQNDELQKSISEMEKKLEKFDEVQEKLTYSEEQIRLYKESTNALTQQVSRLKSEKEEIYNKWKELVNIKPSVPVITRAVLEEQVTALSELVTTRYMYRNATRKEADKTWLWGWTLPFSDVSLLATYDGTITTSIDLKEVRFDVNERSKTITVTMPDSKIFEHNIPQGTINVLEVKNNLFNKITFNDYNKFIAAEKIEMEKVAKEQGLLTQADDNAKKVLEAFLKTVPGIDAYTLKFN